MDRSGIVVGIDVGGTFTDLILIDESRGRARLAKVPSTQDNQAAGVLRALAEVSVDLQDVDLIVHGTTTTTNAIIERKLRPAGLITTRGFRDILELGRRERPQPYGMKGEFTPLIPRNLRLEVDERMDALGKVLVPLDESGLRFAGEQLLERGCEAVAVHFLHSYANAAHELRAAEILREFWPNGYITLGHALLSESREFERGVTAAVNASVQPLLERYVARLAESLRRDGYRSELLIMNGNGGMVSARLVAREAAKTVMSGPASGVMAAAYTGRRAGFANLITYDMGGTSTDVALIENARPSVSNEIELEYAMPIHVPMVDVRTVGAGGGSIARVNEAGLLEVGPESAGATPGPIIYGKGGEKPTITDANFLLGRLDFSLAPSVCPASRGDVEEIFANELGTKLGLTPTEAAAAVIRVANAKMAGATRMVSVSLGKDPRDFAFFAFGGAGPLHASAIARELGIPAVLIPARPGITNALGCVVADLRHDYVTTINRPLPLVEIELVHKIIAGHVRRGEELIKKEKVGKTEIRQSYAVDMQFLGQTHLLHVELADARPGLGELQRRFERAYAARFHVELPEITANLVNVKTSVIGTRRPIELTMLAGRDSAGAVSGGPRAGTRPVYFDGEWMETRICWRADLPVDCTVRGPAIVAQMDTTILVEPGDVATALDDGNLLITIGGD